MYSTVQYSTVLAVLCTAVLCTHALMHCISIHLPAPSPQIGLGPPKGYTITAVIREEEHILGLVEFSLDFLLRSNRSSDDANFQEYTQKVTKISQQCTDVSRTLCFSTASPAESEFSV